MLDDYKYKFYTHSSLIFKVIGILAIVVYFLWIFVEFGVIIFN